MANTGFKGINVWQTGNKLVFRVPLYTSAGAIVTSGTTNLYLYEYTSSGTLKSYDFNDNTFKTTALTTETQAMTHRKGNNNTTDTGVWTYSLSTLTGFLVESVCLIRVNNTSAYPANVYREFQYGGLEGDIGLVKNFPNTGYTYEPNYIGFVMRSSTDHRTVISGASVTAEISIDGAALVVCTNAVQFFGDFYRISLTQSEMNGSVITLRFTATGADDNLLSFIT